MSEKRLTSWPDTPYVPSAFVLCVCAHRNMRRDSVLTLLCFSSYDVQVFQSLEEGFGRRLLGKEVERAGPLARWLAGFLRSLVLTGAHLRRRTALLGSSSG